ncbi:MAG: GH116 family glycosyl-hydrolase [Candidatus Dormiibacterota bacterium]
MTRLVSAGVPGVRYEGERLASVALPVGGIGTGTISVSGQGRWQDWEIENRPAKGFQPEYAFFSVWEREAGASEPGQVRLLEGPLEPPFHGSRGVELRTGGLPRFERCAFDGLYPFGRIELGDSASALEVALEVWNPLLPPDEDRSGIPVAIANLEFRNTAAKPRELAVATCLSSLLTAPAAWAAVEDGGLRGAAVRGRHEWQGSMAVACLGTEEVQVRTGWQRGWKDGLLAFWDALSETGRLPDATEPEEAVAQVLTRTVLEPGATWMGTFLLAWHFPMRTPWATPTPTGAVGAPGIAMLSPDRRWTRNHYATRFADAWDVIRFVESHLDELAQGTRRFAEALWTSDLPVAVRDAAMCSLTALRSETTFRAEDGRLYGWEGCDDRTGCCHGTCTHVWNYEWATPLLFGKLARSMRDTEFLDSTREDGMMSFRSGRPDPERAPASFAAADGQFGCIVKLHREWRLSGEDSWLSRLWPRARAALAWTWGGSGWDRDQDGLPEGCQHHTLDVEYLGPNPLTGFWYLAALRAAEEMARHLGDVEVAERCRRLFESGSRRIVEVLFNGEYFEQADPPQDVLITPEVARPEEVLDLRRRLAQGLPLPHQVGPGCLVDQLVGQLVARLCELGDLADRGAVRSAAKAVFDHNQVSDFGALTNVYRTYATRGDAGLVMVSYPRGGRPRSPVAYFSEAMTGFEYTAAAALIQEGFEQEGLRCVEAVRARYDGHRRNPYDEAECGHHYVRAMASWAVLLSLTGFSYSAQSGEMRIADAGRPCRWFWANGSAWGTVRQRPAPSGTQLDLEVGGGELRIRSLGLRGHGRAELSRPETLRAGARRSVVVPRSSSSEPGPRMGTNR